jgi:hypothetical protein
VVERAGVGFRAYSARTGEALPTSIKLVSHEHDAGMLVPFDFERYEGVTDKKAASDHCPITLRFKL